TRAPPLSQSAAREHLGSQSREFLVSRQCRANATSRSACGSGLSPNLCRNFAQQRLRAKPRTPPVARLRIRFAIPRCTSSTYPTGTPRRRALACSRLLGRLGPGFWVWLLRIAHDLSQACDGVVDGCLTRAEGEARMVQKARSAAASALPRIDVEEVARNGDHLVLQGGTEQRVTGVDRGGQVGQISPTVERALRLAFEAHTERAQAVEHAVALATKGRANGLGLGTRVFRREDRKCGRLH